MLSELNPSCADPGPAYPQFFDMFWQIKTPPYNRCGYKDLIIGFSNPIQSGVQRPWFFNDFRALQNLA